MERESISIVERRRLAPARLLLIVMILAWLPGGMADAQEIEAEGEFIPRTSSGGAVPVQPYAGKYEARIGGSRESAGEKLRLDIGAAVDIYRIGHTRTEGDISATQGALAFGAEFFTWTRLRAAGNFKFPVEAVDYYFGVHGRALFPQSILSEIRLRVAHISAHLVDGDPSFTSPEQRYITYSREFLDLVAGHAHTIPGAGNEVAARVRPYVGAQWLFHTIPDTLGVLTPYCGLDAALQPYPSVPLTLRFGYEGRLNTELVPIGEHQIRLGIKIGDVDARGVLIEGSYYTGRSHYGQHFSRREKFYSLGFGVDY